MRVNSAFTGFFTGGLAGPGIAIAMLAIFFIAPAFRKLPDRDLRAKQVNLIIRQIGHRLLLQAGDSTSRVLPVTEIKEGTFLLKFEKELVFSHDSLMVLSQSLLPKTQFASGYTLTVHDCNKREIVYGFQVNNTAPDILACSGRSQPLGCYTIEFAFPDFYEHVEEKKAGIGHLAAQPNAYPLVVASKREETKTTISDYEVGQDSEEEKHVKENAQEVTQKPEGLKMTTFNTAVYGGILVLLGISLLLWRFGKIVKPVPVQTQNFRIIKEPLPEGSALGNFLFDIKGQRLLSGSEIIPLTDKECKVLELLHKNFGVLIPRETLMQEVWINEGVITGRSLDMFISKLRKKLRTDPRLRITNIHGKGYRLEIINDVIA